MSLTTEWKKSSRSGGNGGQCVEARVSGTAVQIRDSKALGRGPVLQVEAAAWAGFLAVLRQVG